MKLREKWQRRIWEVEARLETWGQRHEKILIAATLTFAVIGALCLLH